MHYHSLRCLTVAALTLLAVQMPDSAFAQSNLPPEARAQIIITQVENALARKDYSGALASLKNLDSVAVARPPALFITEAKLAGQVKDYTRSRAALEKYFKAASSGTPEYKEAAQIYAAIDDLVKAQSGQDQVAWDAATTTKSCPTVVKFLTAPRSEQYALKAVTEFEQMTCPLETLPNSARDLRARTIAGQLIGKWKIAFSDASGREYTRIVDLKPDKTLSGANDVSGRWTVHQDGNLTLFFAVGGVDAMSSLHNCTSIVRGAAPAITCKEGDRPLVLTRLQ